MFIPILLAVTPVDAQTAILAFFNNLITIATNVSFVLAAFFIIWGGFMWVTSNGNTRQMERAKTAIFTALIGLVIILTAGSIANLIFSALKVTPVTQ